MTVWEWLRYFLCRHIVHTHYKLRGHITTKCKYKLGCRVRGLSFCCKWCHLVQFELSEMISVVTRNALTYYKSQLMYSYHTMGSMHRTTSIHKIRSLTEICHTWFVIAILKWLIAEEKRECCRHTKSSLNRILFITVQLRRNVQHSTMEQALRNCWKPISSVHPSHFIIYC